MTAFTVEITETNVVFVPSAKRSEEAERKAVAWIEAHATGDVSVSGRARATAHGREDYEREMADTIAEA